MAVSQWHKLYTSDVAAPRAVLFGLLADMPNYGRWLPGSTAFGRTTDVEPYPVQLGSRYHDGKPDEPGKDWWGTVTGFQPPGSLDFHHTITVHQLRATVDVHIHYSFEPGGGGTPMGGSAQGDRRSDRAAVERPTESDHRPGGTAVEGPKEGYRGRAECNRRGVPT
jgi:hypothetical protein